MHCSYSKSKLKVEYMKLYLYIYEKQKQYCKVAAVAQLEEQLPMNDGSAV